MPTATNDGVAIYYERAGDGAPVLLLGDLGFGAWQWGWQHAALAGPYETVVPETRGCGRSDAPPGPYDLEALAGDATAVIRDADCRAAHVVGAGLGGVVALRLALATGRVRSLTLLGCAPSDEALDLDPLAADPDDEAALRTSLAAALSDGFREHRPDVVDRIVDWRRAEDADPVAWRAQRAALDGFDVRDRLLEVTVPALVVHGTADARWPPERGERLADDLPRGRFEPVDGAGHLVGVEASRVVNDELLGFLATVEDEDGR
ncbi:MAG: alpha/beta fold hydrolase [Haloferacaceae archaeon]